MQGDVVRSKFAVAFDWFHLKYRRVLGSQITVLRRMLPDLINGPSELTVLYLNGYDICFMLNYLKRYIKSGKVVEDDALELARAALADSGQLGFVDVNKSPQRLSTMLKLAYLWSSLKDADLKAIHDILLDVEYGRR